MMVYEPDLDVSLFDQVEHSVGNVNRIILVYSCVLFALGTTLNLWFLLAVMTSPHHRARLRSQLLCNLCVLHLAVSLVKSPVMIFYSRLLLDTLYMSTMCDAISLAVPLEVAYSFIEDWLLVFIATAFLFNVLDCDPSRSLGAWSVTVAKIFIHILPWVISPALTPLLKNLLPSYDWCLAPLSYDKIKYALDHLLAPNSMCAVITSAACAFFCKRAARASASGNMSSRSVYHSSEVDSPVAYVVSVSMNVACESALIYCVFELAAGSLVR